MISVARCLQFLACLSIPLGIAACGGAIEPSGSSSDSAPGAGAGGAAGSSGACTASPACNLGDTPQAPKSGCHQDDGRCYSRTTCGTKIWCARAEHSVDVDPHCPRPSCQPGFIEVKACIPDAECATESLCGSTIVCMRDGQCDGLPECNSGHTKIPSQAQCLPDGVCYSRSSCGATIWCTAP